MIIIPDLALQLPGVYSSNPRHHLTDGVRIRNRDELVHDQHRDYDHHRPAVVLGTRWLNQVDMTA